MAQQNVVLVSCVKRKLATRARAEQLYTSVWFRMALAYARSLRPTAIFVLSAKYGLLDLDRQVMPYEQTLARMAKADRLVWAEGVLAELARRFDLAADRFTILAGRSTGSISNAI